VSVWFPPDPGPELDPDPDTEIFAGGPGTLLATITVPLALPDFDGSNFTVTVEDSPGASVTFEPPLTLKPLPETDTDLTSTFVLPVLFKVTSWLLVFPTPTLPKLRAAGVTERPTTGLAPLPARSTVTRESSAVLVIDIVPDKFPAVAGLNVAKNETVCPGDTVSGTARPETLNPAPVVDTFVIFMFALPEAFSSRGSLTSRPTTTSPKLPEEGVTAIIAPVPVPSRPITMGTGLASVTREMLPLAAPVDPGAKSAVKLALFPASIVSGTEIPFTLNPPPLIVTRSIFALAVPVLRIFIPCCPVLPVATFPKFTDRGVTSRRAKPAAGFPFGLPETPMHAAIPKLARQITAIFAKSSDDNIPA